ncbi:MAG TPA: phosphomethylpyrimidine synthase ThiC, partial [Alphaproteobacteria bacterium]|nr:phosphomethylpyrimidine synthase ThiC [Alphaproteobacteria bacterium]
MTPKDQPGVCPSTLHVTRGAISGSKKTYVSDLKVPMREITLTNGETFQVYDTSGPYTDDAANLDIMRGLPQLRQQWILDRGDVEEIEGRTVQAIDNGYKDDQHKER